MHFIVLFGPPAVGKMTVGDEITRLTGIPVFHNHLSIEPVLRFFPFGHPAFGRIVDEFRRHLLAEVARSDLPGAIFTFVWNMDAEDDARFLGDLCEPFAVVGAEITLVELKADLEQRLMRNRTEQRLEAKPSKRNLERSEKNLLDVEQRFRMNSNGSIPLPYRHVLIDNTELAAVDVAGQIVEMLGIPRGEAGSPST
jgi:hypothetical protein